MTILLSLLISVNAYALNSLEKEFALSYQCMAEINSRHHGDLFAPKSKHAREIAQTMGRGWVTVEYAIWSEAEKKLQYLRYINADDGASSIRLMKVDQPPKYHNKYVISHLGSPDVRSEHDFTSCPIAFSPTKGLSKKNTTVYQEPNSYADCGDSSGAKEIEAPPAMGLDRQTLNIFEQAIVDQLQRTDAKFFMQKSAPEATIKDNFDAKRMKTRLPFLKKKCLAVKSEKVRTAFLDFVTRAKAAYPSLNPPRSKGKEQKGAGGQ